MVRVFYEPPPGGPRSHLNRGAYYIESEATPALLKRMQRMNPAIAITASVATIAALCYVPLCKYSTFFPDVSKSWSDLFDKMMSLYRHTPTNDTLLLTHFVDVSIYSGSEASTNLRS